MTLLLSGQLPSPWQAGMAWCAAPRENRGQRAFFRRMFDLTEVPDAFRVFVSADSRYRLFVNGTLVGRGPLKGTLRRYHVEEYEIAELLRPGANVLAADVLWFGVNAPLSEEHSGFAGFLVQGPEGAGIDTPGDWKARADTSLTWDRTPYTCNAHLFIAGMEHIQGARYPSGFAKLNFDDSGWGQAVLAVPLNAPGGDPKADLIWNFAPRDIPALIEEPKRFVRTIEDMTPAPHRFGETPVGWSLTPGEGGEIVLDAGSLTTGYPTLTFEGGEGRTAEIVYSECVWHKVPGTEGDTSPYRWGAGGRLFKGVRDELAGGVIHGYQDTVVLPGGTFTYEPHHWRTFWFVRIIVSSGPDAFTLRDVSYRFTTFPQTCQATFSAPDVPDIRQMWDVSWRTLQLCTHETYEDCPGYEQLNYLLDARNEALTTLALTGDTAMPRRTIALFRDTLRPDGLLSSRTPSQVRQTIPLFALWWVQMVLDYWDWVGPRDGELVRSCLIAVDAVLSYFRERQRTDGFLGELSYWNPIGGEDALGADLEPAIAEGGSTYVTALYLTVIEAARRLHQEAGHPEDAARWEPTRRRLRRAVASAWSPTRSVFVESLARPDSGVSQHTQAAVLRSGAARPGQVRRLAAAMVRGTPLAPMTRQQGLPFSEAMWGTGHYDVAVRQTLAEYREQLGLHLTTWVEGPLEGRSDCHAWSAWLPVELLRSVLGIRPAKPGFAEILIAPQAVFPSALGAMPTPVGEVTVSWQAVNGRIQRLTASAPVGVPTTVRIPGRAPQTFPSGGSIRIDVSQG